VAVTVAEAAGGGVTVALLSEGTIQDTATLPPGPVRLRVTFTTAARVRLWFGQGNGALQTIGPEIRVAARSGSWIGAKVGLFAHAPDRTTAPGHADFAHFRFAALSAP
jgi:hypothetical protein